MSKDNNERKIEGPARLEQDNLDETGLNYSYGVNSRRDGLTSTYGDEGVGWEVVLPEDDSPEKKRNRKIGRGMVRIVVTPDGDRHYHDKFN